MRWNVRRRSTAATIGASVAALAVVAAPIAGFAVASASAAPGATALLAETFDGLTTGAATTGALVQSGKGGTIVDDGTGNKYYEISDRTMSYDALETPSTLLDSLPVGTQVTISMDIRLAPGTAASHDVRWVLKPGWTWPNQQPGWAGDGNTTLAAASAGTWQTISDTYTTDGTQGVSFYTGTDSDNTSPFTFDLDNITVTIPSSAPTSSNLVASDFESSYTPWAPHGTATLGLSTDAHGGSKSLLVSGRGDTWMGTQVDLTTQTVEGATYTVDAWVKRPAGETATGQIKMSSDTKDESGTEAWGQVATRVDSGTSTDASTWVHLQGTWQRPAGLASVLFYIEAADTGSFLVDDVTISGELAGSSQVQTDLEPIKQSVDFPVGAAVSDPQLSGDAGQLLKLHFDQVTPENTMKPEAWYDANHSFVTTNTSADLLMTYAHDNGMRVHGHTLVWYQQTPDWFFQDDQGNFLTNSAADQAIMRQRLKDHIDNVAKYLSDKYGAFGSATNPLVSFDVVNEVVADQAGGDGLRTSHWYQILGESYIEEAFNDANEAFNGTYADPNVDHPVQLFINDYSTEQPGKRGRLLDLVNLLIAHRVPVDGVGHQFHVTMATPVSALKDAFDAFNGLTTARGVPLLQDVSELDVPTGTPVTTANKIDQGYYYKAVFDMLRDEWNAGAKIWSVTLWGLTDGQSWRNSEGAPLLFDNSLQAKPAYYGVTDQALPAKIRAATAFKEAASTDDAQPTSLEWSKLPLNQVDANAAFQLRWATDHLTAYVKVADSTLDATDAVKLGFGDDLQATVNRDGTVTGAGVTATVASTGSGWQVVAKLPEATALTEGSSTGFDVAVTDGVTTNGWATPALGSVQLVEELSYTAIPEAATAPAIDGVRDAVWDTASTVTTSKLIQGAAGGATAVVSQLWKGQYLYVYADVTDPTVDSTAPNPWERDSVEIFTDPGNAKNGAYRTSDAQMRIGANGDVSFGAGDTETAQAARLVSHATIGVHGYVVEARIDLGAATTGVGTFQGVDYEVNDGTNGARTSNSGWAEQTGKAYQTTARWGVAQLVAATTSGTGGTGGTGGSTGGTADPTTVTGAHGETLTISSGTVAAGGFLVVSATGLTAGDPVQVILHSKPVVLAKGTVAANGTFSATVKIPASTPAGLHHIEVATPHGSLTVALTVTKDPSGALAATGSDVRDVVAVALLALLLGGLAFGGSRVAARRR